MGNFLFLLASYFPLLFQKQLFNNCAKKSNIQEYAHQKIPSITNFFYNHKICIQCQTDRIETNTPFFSVERLNT